MCLNVWHTLTLVLMVETIPPSVFFFISRFSVQFNKAIIYLYQFSVTDPQTTKTKYSSLFIKTKKFQAYCFNSYFYSLALEITLLFTLHTALKNNRSVLNIRPFNKFIYVCKISAVLYYCKVYFNSYFVSCV